MLLYLFTCIVGQDLNSFSTPVVFGAGETKRTVQINIRDVFPESLEVLQINLSRLDVGVVIGEPSQALATIKEYGKLEDFCVGVQICLNFPMYVSRVQISCIAIVYSKLF